MLRLVEQLLQLKEWIVRLGALTTLTICFR